VYLGRFRGICDLGVDYFETVFVTEPRIPQLVYGSIYKLRNEWFCNTFRHLPMSCGTTHSATCIRIRNKICYSLQHDNKFLPSLVLGLLIVVLLTTFVHHWVISLHIIKLILSVSNYQMEIKSLLIILEVFFN